METEKLLKHLRNQRAYGIPEVLFNEAADKIEELETKIKELEHQNPRNTDDADRKVGTRS